MIKSWITLICISLYAYQVIGQDAPLNIIDSLGYKQGEWTEFEARPKEVGYTINDDLINNESVVLFEYDFNDLVVYRLVGEYKNSLRIGEWKLFTSTGVHIKTYSYTGGIINGPFEFLNNDGTVRIKGVIESGKKLTKVEKYSDSGVLVKSYYLETKDLVRSMIK